MSSRFSGSFHTVKLHAVLLMPTWLPRKVSVKLFIGRAGLCQQKRAAVELSSPLGRSSLFEANMLPTRPHTTLNYGPSPALRHRRVPTGPSRRGPVALSVLSVCRTRRSPSDHVIGSSLALELESGAFLVELAEHPRLAAWVDAPTTKQMVLKVVPVLMWYPLFASQAALLFECHGGHFAADQNRPVPIPGAVPLFLPHKITPTTTPFVPTLLYRPHRFLRSPIDRDAGPLNAIYRPEQTCARSVCRRRKERER